MPGKRRDVDNEELSKCFSGSLLVSHSNIILNHVFDHKGWSNIQDMNPLKDITGVPGTGPLHLHYNNYFMPLPLLSLFLLLTFEQVFLSI